MVSKTGAFFGSTLAANYSWIGKRILVVVIVTPVGSNMRVFFLCGFWLILPPHPTYSQQMCLFCVCVYRTTLARPEPACFAFVVSLRNAARP